MFKKVLIANRGEIACRIIRTLKKTGIVSVAVYSQADAHSMHVIMADEAYEIGPASPVLSYLNGDEIIRVAVMCGAEAIHPGYGFLSENHDFSEKCRLNGITFIGPSPDHIRDFGLKHMARALAIKFGLPVLPGSDILPDYRAAEEAADAIGYPVMVKSTAGGGGIGMELCRSKAMLEKTWKKINRLSHSNFGGTGIFLEKYIEHARHVEVQIFGNGKGEVLVLGDRDCSVQRRNQKIIEEAPAPHLSETVRSDLHHAAERLAAGVGYESAGTVEFIYDSVEEKFYFLEVNSRLQVEHCVTEAIFGIDLVAWMIAQAAGELPRLADLRTEQAGAAIEVRLYAEDPGKQFQPASGTVTDLVFPENARIETWIKRGADVTPYYDPLLAKIIVHGTDRNDAVSKLVAALENTRIGGFETNLLLLKQIAGIGGFINGSYTTRILNGLEYQAPTVEVMFPGIQSTVQDVPGRTGYWNVGVPPSGPMDSLGHRLANRIVGNHERAAALELTLTGPTLKFNTDAVIAIAGAEMVIRLDGSAVPMYTPVPVGKGQILECGAMTNGQRACIAVRGGFDVPLYMGSRSTFTLGLFGGHGGRVLKSGDILHIGDETVDEPRALPEPMRPDFSEVKEISVLYGPHGAPDFFTREDIDTFFATSWEVHYNSSRTGVRLIGPHPGWARTDGGEAGLHPSNIHDNAYAVGTVDFTGDMPVILGPDGPSLGGFVCPATIVQADLWKMGQLRPGDKITFRRISLAEAERLEILQDDYVRTFEKSGPVTGTPDREEPAVIAVIEKTETSERVVYRRAGDKYILVEYGEPVLDLKLRFRVHILMEELETMAVEGIQELTPGIRSLQIRYDNRTLKSEALLDILFSAEERINRARDFSVRSRIVNLPLSWDDPSTHTAIRKYTQSVRPDAPWCPSNIDFIRRINGLDSVEQVRDIVFGASYLVMGLGDVYLGAPVATPMDPRNRLVTTKYNPARTWTPENAVGIGGAYLCVYGMEGPGGYQFVGRTLQMWNRYNVTPEFEENKPWLLRFFDQIRFYPVSGDELMKIRQDFPHGLFHPDIEETVLNLEDYENFLSENRDSIRSFKEKQQAAFDRELQLWIKNGQMNFRTDEPADDGSQEKHTIEEGADPVVSPVSGSIWKINVTKDQTVKKGDILAVMECMKMEIEITANTHGTVGRILCAEGTQISSGDCLMGILPERTL